MPTLFLIIFVDLVGFGLVIPLLPFYAVRFGGLAATSDIAAGDLFVDAAVCSAVVGRGSATGSGGGRC